ncbi:hypothetical protein [uncultured Jatrophihabitans sp.]|uniref:hypothetical protein n=1 Tax=uncultured Jatrophihabitans sp. TaxID=1610747 RepID=UPI0035CB8029
MSAAHRAQLCTGDIVGQWSRLVADLERYGLLGGPGACDALARVGTDVLQRGSDAHVDASGQVAAP